MATHLPNLFIVGAPKCGTSALFEYLRSHPAVCASAVKEPHHFNRDLRPHGRYANRERYLGLFRPRDRQRYLMEASTLYLRSAVAIPDILEFNPSAKFIAMVRDPVDMACALHAQQLRDLIEDEHDLFTALALEEDRLAGRSRPASCPDARLVCYRWMCRLGEQIDRLFELVPQGQRLVLRLEELAADPRAAYLKTLRFLGLEPDGRDWFPRVNARMGFRSPAVAGALRTIRRLRLRLGIERGLGLQRLIEPLLLGPAKTASPQARRVLAEDLRADATRLASLLEREQAAGPRTL